MINCLVFTIITKIV